MPSADAQETLRQQIERDANHRCGYCLTPQSFLPVSFEIEHIVPRSGGGQTVRENLWLSCPSCNRFKGTKSEALDSDTATVAPLFNPRTQQWFVHFRWSGDGTLIIGLTTTGRATVAALRLNHDWWIPCRTEWALRDDFPPLK